MPNNSPVRDLANKIWMYRLSEKSRRAAELRQQQVADDNRIKAFRDSARMQVLHEAVRRAGAGESVGDLDLSAFPPDVQASVQAGGLADDISIAASVGDESLRTALRLGQPLTPEQQAQADIKTAVTERMAKIPALTKSGASQKRELSRLRGENMLRGARSAERARSNFLAREQEKKADALRTMSTEARAQNREDEETFETGLASLLAQRRFGIGDEVQEQMDNINEIGAARFGDRWLDVQVNAYAKSADMVRKQFFAERAGTQGRPWKNQLVDSLVIAENAIAAGLPVPQNHKWKIIAGKKGADDPVTKRFFLFRGRDANRLMRGRMALKAQIQLTGHLQGRLEALREAQPNPLQAGALFGADAWQEILRTADARSPEAAAYVAAATPLIRTIVRETDDKISDADYRITAFMIPGLTEYRSKTADEMIQNLVDFQNLRANMLFDEDIQAQFDRPHARPETKEDIKLKIAHEKFKSVIENPASTEEELREAQFEYDKAREIWLPVRGHLFDPTMGAPMSVKAQERIDSVKRNIKNGNR